MLHYNDHPVAQKQKIFFIHFTPTDPLMHKLSEAYKEVKSKGFNWMPKVLKYLFEIVENIT
jgi:hypothetical protein